MTDRTVDNPFFARVWKTMSELGACALRRLRAEDLAWARRPGAGGRCRHRDQLRLLSVAGDRGGCHRARTLTWPRWLAAARREGPGPGDRRAPTPSRSSAAQNRSTRWSARWVLCSIEQPDTVLRQLFSLLRPGGELRYLEHRRGQRVAGRDAAGRRCHGVAAAARQLPHPSAHRADRSRRADSRSPVAHRELAMPAWVPLPVTEFAIGRAVEPASKYAEQRRQPLQQVRREPSPRSRAARPSRCRTGGCARD